MKIPYCDNTSGGTLHFGYDWWSDKNVLELS